MPRPRAHLLVPAALLAVLAGGAALVLSPPSEPGASRADLEKVRRGMTRGQVEAAVGTPPGHYADGEVDLTWPRASEAPDEPWTYCAEWVFEDGILLVYFDERDVAVRAETFNVGFYRGPSFVERVWDRLGR